MDSYVQKTLSGSIMILWFYNLIFFYPMYATCYHCKGFVAYNYFLSFNPWLTIYHAYFHSLRKTIICGL